METSFFIAFILGLISTMHCWGMCGGIVGALSISLPAEINKDILGRLLYISMINTGRVISYVIAGFLIGSLGYHISQLISPSAGHQVLQIAAGIVLVFIGLHLTGWLPYLRRIESIGLRLWQFIQPLGRRFIPINTLPKALMMGIIWGWLPCALVYAVLLWASTGGSGLNGSLLMLSFGIGTLPGMLSAGFAGNKLFSLSRRQSLRKVIGIVLVIFGCTTFYLSGVHHIEKHQHQLY